MAYRIARKALPFRSQRTSRCRHENVKMDGQIISYQPGKGDDRVGSYIAEDPLTPQNYYFEVKILDIGTNGTIGVGLVSSNYPMYNQPGWKELSVGFHADDGHLYLSAGYGDEFGPTSTTGDTIGCGIEFPLDADKYEILVLQHVEVFFTHNGKKVGSTTISLPKSGLFPAVGLHSRGEKVKLNLEVNVFVPALPPRDKRTSRCRYENVRVNGEVISYQPGKGDDRVGLYTAGDPLTPHNYYFEVEILDIGADGLIGVGLVPSNYPRYRQPGWEQSSVGFHADDGHLYLSAGFGDEFGPTSTTGDTIGCGIQFPADADKDEILNLQHVEVFFTHNGKKVGSTITALPRSGFFPAVGLHSRGEKVKLNLEADFLLPVFDVEREKPAFVSQDSNSFQDLRHQGNWEFCLIKQHGNAVWKCINCEDYLCEACKESHKLGRITRKHRLLHISEKEKETSVLKEVFCTIHEKKELEMYCVTDCKSICVLCVADASHRGHELESLNEYAEKIRYKVGSSLSSADSVYPKIGDNMENVRTILNSQLSGSDDLIDSVMKNAIAQIKLNAANLKATEKGKAEILRKRERDLKQRQVDVKSKLLASRRFLETCTDAELIEKGQRFIEDLDAISLSNGKSEPDESSGQLTRNEINQKLGMNLFI